MIWESIKPNKDELEWQELWQTQSAKMINVFKLPPDLLGTLSDTNHHHAEVQAQVYRNRFGKKGNAE